MEFIKRQLSCLLLLLFTSVLAQGQVTLLEAVSENDYINIELYLQKGYNAFDVEHSGVSLAEYAVSSGNRDLMTTIINNTNAISNQDVFFLFSKAIDYKQTDIIEYLLSANLHNNIDYLEMYNLVTIAVQHDDVQIYQLLTEYFPSVDEDYKDFLFTATRSDRFNIFSFIFKSKNIKASEKDTEESLLHAAVTANSHSIATFLVNKNADINALNTEGQTPLDYAHKAGDIAMIRLFESALKKR